MTSLPHKYLNSLVSAASLVLALTAGAAAQQSAPRLPENIVKSQRLDAESEKAVTAFITDVLGKLAGPDSRTVALGREMVVASLNRQPSSPAFRVLFAAKVLPGLKKLVAEGSTFQATNALEVVKVLQCPDSILYLSEQSSPKRQPSQALRLVAANGLANPQSQVDLSTGQVDAILKPIGASIAQESDWMIASYDLQALLALSVSAQVPKASQALARSLLVAGLDGTTTRIRKALANSDGSQVSDLQLIRALNRVLAIYLRDRVPVAVPADVATFARSIEPTLKSMASMPSGALEGADAEAFAQAAKTAKRVLSLIAPSGAPGNPSGKPLANSGTSTATRK